MASQRRSADTSLFALALRADEVANRCLGSHELLVGTGDFKMRQAVVVFGLQAAADMIEHNTNLVAFDFEVFIQRSGIDQLFFVRQCERP